MHRQAQVSERRDTAVVLATEAVDYEHGLLGLRGRSWSPIQEDISPDHHLRQFGGRGFSGVYSANNVTISQHSNLIGNLFHFPKLMTDKDDRTALISQASYGLKELLCLRRCKDGCGLVEDQYACIPEK
jgi:hypothetical protein